jgi:hypothetical protein
VAALLKPPDALFDGHGGFLMLKRYSVKRHQKVTQNGHAEKAAGILIA